MSILPTTATTTSSSSGLPRMNPGLLSAIVQARGPEIEKTAQGTEAVALPAIVSSSAPPPPSAPPNAAIQLAPVSRDDFLSSIRNGKALKKHILVDKPVNRAPAVGISSIFDCLQMSSKIASRIASNKDKAVFAAELSKSATTIIRVSIWGKDGGDSVFETEISQSIKIDRMDNIKDQIEALGLKYDGQRRLVIIESRDITPDGVMYQGEYVAQINFEKGKSSHTVKKPPRDEDEWDDNDCQSSSSSSLSLAPPRITPRIPVKSLATPAPQPDSSPKLNARQDSSSVAPTPSSAPAPVSATVAAISPSEFLSIMIKRRVSIHGKNDIVNPQQLGNARKPTFAAPKAPIVREAVRQLTPANLGPAVNIDYAQMRASGSTAVPVMFVNLDVPVTEETVASTKRAFQPKPTGCPYTRGRDPASLEMAYEALVLKYESLKSNHLELLKEHEHLIERLNLLYAEFNSLWLQWEQIQSDMEKTKGFPQDPQLKKITEEFFYNFLHDKDEKLSLSAFCIEKSGGNTTIYQAFLQITKELIVDFKNCAHEVSAHKHEILMQVGLHQTH